MTSSETVYGYAGKILRVNLSDGAVSTESTLPYTKQWLGSTGIAIKILYDELKPWVTPYEPANKVIFGAGVLMGTTAPGACKSSISTLGPMTGGWASGLSDSYVGGQLKYAGYDAVVIEGKAHTPVYLWIDDDRVELRDAAHLWGMTTWDTLDTLRVELSEPTLHIVSIGPAGENLVRGACVIQDKGRAFGRCGTGAVLGSKNLKAIAVRGTGSVKVAEPEKFTEAVRQARAMIVQTSGVQNMRRVGTLNLKGKIDGCGVNYKNFQDCTLPDEMAEAIEPAKSIDKYEVSRHSFPGCAVGCSRLMHITEGPYAGLKTEACQMEALNTIQNRLAVWEPTFMFKANAYCNELGLDLDAAGSAIGWAMECFQRGIIDEKDADGLTLEWGDTEVILELMRKIAYREGFGNILAEGCARAADILGRNSSYYAMHIKGQDLYEPCRGSLGWSLGTTTSTRGGGHTTGATYDLRPVKSPQEKERARSIFRISNPYTPIEYEGKPEMVTYTEALHRVNNSLGVCHFNTIHLDINEIELPELAELYSLATGWETSVEELKRIAMRQLNLEKAFNLRHTNFDRKDDLPTARDQNEPIPSGNLKGWKMDMEKYNEMLDQYYELHDWDKETSFPTRKALEDLDLGSVADDLEKIGKLSPSGTAPPKRAVKQEPIRDIYPVDEEWAE
jgi:aldehyde:ferredoxin oxidoreductase